MKTYSKIIIITYFIIICIIYLPSCSIKPKLTNELTQFQSSSIVLPTKHITIFNDKDNIIPNIDRGIKLVVYNDSIGCSTCAINKMYLWGGFIKYAKSYNGRLRYYFIYNPSKKDIDNIRITLQGSLFEYPILLDTLGEFERLNQYLPKNKAMHTFLLDENNKVILVGNPLNNKEIEKLFYKKTQELLNK